VTSLPLEPTPRLGPSAAPAPLVAGDTASALPGARFSQLLEALERLRLEAAEKADDPAPLQSLDRAMDAAHDAHRTAMDLKQSLEAAFKKALGR
jgi:hypothetical protein